MPLSNPSRRGKYANTIGRQAEEAVAQHLLNNNYVLLGRNVRIGHLELDIVARKGPLVAIVEVRHRGPTAWTTALESITPTKRAKIFAAADRLWTTRLASDPTIHRVRMDVAIVTTIPAGHAVEYLEGALTRW